MNHDAALRRHARAVAYVRWQLAAEKHSALRRAHADAAVGESELRAAAEELRQRHEEWSALGADEPVPTRDHAAPRRRDEATQ
jgi:hypothetical protein